MVINLTRRQEEIYDFLKNNLHTFAHPPTLDELCDALGLKSRGSLHKQVQALINAGLLEPMNNLRRGIRLTDVTHGSRADTVSENADELPLYGAIAAGRPIEAMQNPDTILVPETLRTNNPCYVLEVKGDSMIEEGILDGDWVVIEQRQEARNGEIVVALVDDADATLKRLEKKRDQVILHPANNEMQALVYPANQVQIQGVLVGQMRSYH